ESRYEGREQLALTHRPGRRTSHHLMGKVGELPAEVALAIEECPHDAGCVAAHDAHCGKLELVQESVPAMDSCQSHASSRAASAGRSRLRDAPTAALTMISNNASSPYWACTRATSSSAT